MRKPFRYRLPIAIALSACGMWMLGRPVDACIGLSVAVVLWLVLIRRPRPRLLSASTKPPIVIERLRWPGHG